MQDEIAGRDGIRCRTRQVEALCNLIGVNEGYVGHPALFVYGHTATGKTLVVKHILQKNNKVVASAYVNCIECYNQRILYDLILSQLLDQVSEGHEIDDGPSMKCDNTNDFVRHLNHIIREYHLQKTCIVFDKADRLRDMEGHVLPAILRLHEFTNSNTCVILISEIVWEKYWQGTGFFEPYKIHFPEYKKDELLQILSLDCPGAYPAEFYGSYVNLLLSVFYMACRDLSELRHMARINFKKYCQPITDGEATITDSRKLWRNIEPHLKKALQTVYLRHVSSSQWENSNDETSPAPDSTASAMKASSHRAMELPFYPKFLLVSAYLASYNPSKTDRKFFSKAHTKIKKKARTSQKKEILNQMLGPKMFPLDRLMAIFYSIVEDKVSPSANIFSQISTLVCLRMLAKVGSDDVLDTPKYKCLVSFDFIRSVARSVGFDIVRYLYDYT